MSEAAPPEDSGRKVGGQTLIRLKVVVQRTGLPISSIYEMMDNDEFPHSVELSERRVAWVEAEIDAWIAARIAERDEKLERIPLTRATLPGQSGRHSSTLPTGPIPPSATAQTRRRS